MTKNFTFGDLITILQKTPNLIVIISNNSIKFAVVKNIEQQLANAGYNTLYLTYDDNKSLMLDLNIRSVPVVIFFKNMDPLPDYILYPFTFDTIKQKAEILYAEA